MKKMILLVMLTFMSQADVYCQWTDDTHTVQYCYDDDGKSWYVYYN